MSLSPETGLSAGIITGLSDKSGLSLNFSPLDFNNLSAWWDALDETTFAYTSGITVSSWRDKSANQWSLAGTGNRPDRIASGIGGKPAVQFVAADTERLFFTPATHALLDPEAGGFSVFMVVDIGTTTTVIGMLQKGNTASANTGWSMYAEGAAVNQFRVRSRTSSGDLASQSRAIITDPIVYSAEWTGSQVLGYVNNSNASWTNGGGGASDNTYTGTITTTSDFSLGTLGTQYGNITVGEIIIYKRVLSAAERAAVHAYLYRKWSITP